MQNHTIPIDVLDGVPNGYLDRSAADGVTSHFASGRRVFVSTFGYHASSML